MASVCTPAAVVTSIHRGIPHGTMVSAFASLSMNPVKVPVSRDRGSERRSMVVRAKVSAIAVLGQDQPESALRIAGKRGAWKFDGVDWISESDSPRIVSGATIWPAQQAIFLTAEAT